MTHHQTHMNKGLWIALAVIVVLLAGWYFFQSGAPSTDTGTPASPGVATVDTDAAAEAADAFFALLAAGKTSEAYAALGKAVSSEQTEAQFAAAMQQVGFTNYASASWRARTKGTQVILEGTVTLKDGSKVPTQLEVEQQDGIWKVTGINVG